MPWNVTADVDRYDEAVNWFQARTVVTGREAAGLGAKLRNEAFWIGGGLQLEQVQRVFDKMVPALEKGIPFDEWRKQVRGELRNDAHAETVFRNAAQRAYNAGRYAQMTEPSVVKFRPFWMYDSILDSRTTPICTVCNKVIREAGDAWWDEHFPPQHHRCRASVRNMRASEADRRGGVTETPPDVKAQGTWGLRPGLSPVPKPTRATKDPTLVTALGKKQAKASVRVPKPKKQHTPEHWEKHYTKQYGADAAKAVGHGRASMELGLDMPLKEVIEQLQKLTPSEFPIARYGINRADEVLRQHGAKATLREHGADLDPMLRAAAGVAGHLKIIKPRATAIAHPDLQRETEGRRALKFFSTMTPDSVTQPVRVSFVKTTKRAYFSSSQQKVEWNTTIGVLEHEWAHALEDLNPALARRAEAYLRARTGSDMPRRLKDIPGAGQYEAWEITKEDQFIDPYMGKWYENNAGRMYATELTSMGAEVLVAGSSGWGNLTGLLKKDPDTFWFTLGQLAHP